MFFITGCNGLVGSYIARKLLIEGEKVTALKRAESDLTLVADIADQITWVEGDVLDITRLQQIIEEGSTVIHAAAMVSFDPKAKKQLFKVNVEGTANMVNVCLQKKVAHFLQVSSVASLGRSKEKIHMDETSKWENSSLNTLYAQSKYLAEMEVWRSIAEGLPAVIINPSVVLGVGDWHKSSAQLFKYVYDKKPFYATGSVNYVDVRDVADIAFQLLAKKTIGERFVVSANSTNYQTLFTAIAQRFEVKPPTIKVTPLLAALAWRVSKLQHWLTGKPPFITKETAQLSQLTYHYENEKVKQHLDFTFRTLEETLNWACPALMKKYTT
ncbi:MAG: NAD-dependent epimerase/dehydratase family protein [Thermonemataceae bacterium]